MLLVLLSIILGQDNINFDRIDGASFPLSSYDGDQPKFVVAKNEKEWESLKSTLNTNKISYSFGKKPDFSKEYVACLFIGKSKYVDTSIYTHETRRDRIGKLYDKVTIQYEVRYPRGNRILGDSLSPFLLKVLRHKDLEYQDGRELPLIDSNTEYEAIVDITRGFLLKNSQN